MKIKSIEISGIWGYKTITTDFREDVNIFIGTNGTSKTTFLNIIEAVLLVDLEMLYQISFLKTTLVLEGGKKTRKIVVEKLTENINFPQINYSIGTKKFPLTLQRDMDYRSSNRIHPKIRNIILQLKNELSELVNVSWLSVHRDVYDMEENEFINRRENRARNTVDQRLSELMKRLTFYRLQLESESNKMSDKFKEQVFELMLYKEEYDHIKIPNVQSFDTDTIKKELLKTFVELGLSSQAITQKIEIHIEKLSLALGKIKEAKADKKIQLNVNDVTPLPLLNRTKSLISISKGNDEQKQIIFKPIVSYLNCLKEFIPDKKFKLDGDKSGDLKPELIKKLKADESIPLSLQLLSSGEKQLIILLTEALLQKNENYIFIADEPELSLHVSWQRKIISAIRDLNSNAQIIVATHSPEVAGKWRDNIINMENITSYE